MQTRSNKRLLICLILCMLFLGEMQNISTNASVTRCSKRQGSQQIICENSQNDQSYKRCQLEFFNEKNERQLKMCLITIQQLLLQIFDKITFKSYQLRINQEFLKENKDRNFIFSQPQHFIDQFSENFNQIQLEQNGVIKYNYSVGKVKRVMTLVAKEVPDNFKEVVIRQVIKLRKIIEELKNENRMLKDMMKKEDKEIKAEISKNAEICKENSEKLAARALESETKIKEIYDILYKRNLNAQINPIKNPHSYLFEVYNLTPNSLLIRKIGGNGFFHNFYMTPTIKLQTVTSYKFKAVSNNFWIGISSENTFGKINEETWRHLQTVNLCIYCGNMHIRGGNPNVMPGQPNNSIIEMIVDTNKWTITWIVNSNRVVSEIIPEKMRSQAIYIQISSGDIGSSIEVFRNE